MFPYWSLIKNQLFLIECNVRHLVSKSRIMTNMNLKRYWIHGNDGASWSILSIGMATTLISAHENQPKILSMYLKKYKNFIDSILTNFNVFDDNFLVMLESKEAYKRERLKPKPLLGNNYVNLDRNRRKLVTMSNS